MLRPNPVLTARAMAPIGIMGNHGEYGYFPVRYVTVYQRVPRHVHIRLVKDYNLLGGSSHLVNGFMPG